MNGPHDLGGAQGFGPVAPERDEPRFHADWERAALGLTLAMGATGQWNLDQSRHARESLPPAQYLTSSYYAIWIAALEHLMLERGLVTVDELADGHARHPGPPLGRVLKVGEVDGVLTRGTPTSRPAPAVARFAPGQRVRARQMHPPGHTRLPRYLRGHVGTVVRCHGAHVYPDAHAAAHDGPPFDESPQWLYSVRFEAQTVWGPDADRSLAITADLWEPYLAPWHEPAPVPTA